MRDLDLFERQARYEYLNKRIKTYLNELQKDSSPVDRQRIAQFCHNACMEQQVVCRDIMKVLLPG